MTYQLYWAKETGALAPQILLEEIEADYDRVVLDLEKEDQKTAKFLAINPMGQIPALELEDGSILTESAAIMMHIADSHIELDLIPLPGTPQRAHIYRWMFFAVANIYEADLRIFYSDAYSDDSNCHESIIQKGRQDLNAAWDLIEQAIGDGPYFMDERYSIIDPYLLMLAYWHEQVDQLFERLPKLKVLCETVQQRPAVQSVWHQHYTD
ncbi:MAG: glutathione S-transferase [Gammaproteobacteria bacterium]|jgi:glutathione S-transferase